VSGSCRCHFIYVRACMCAPAPAPARACPPARLPACPPARLPACPPARLPACPPSPVWSGLLRIAPRSVFQAWRDGRQRKACRRAWRAVSVRSRIASPHPAPSIKHPMGSLILHPAPSIPPPERKKARGAIAPRALSENQDWKLEKEHHKNASATTCED
jgi:hypothetical protein